jgi:hypothetical protein
MYKYKGSRSQKLMRLKKEFDGDNKFRFYSSLI